MKKTQLLDLLTTIRGTITSFLAITMFVALGVGLFLGIHWIAGAMFEGADQQLNAGHAHHLEISFPYGLTEEDIAQLEQVEGVDEVEAGYLTFQQMADDDAALTVRVGTLPQHIDTFFNVDGELPQSTDQIAIESNWANERGVKVGDSIMLLSDFTDEDGMRYLNESTFTITALVQSPSYLAKGNDTYGVATTGSGQIDVLAWVVEDAFDAEAFEGGRPYVLVRSHALDDLPTFSAAYKTASDELEQRVKTLGTRLADERFRSLYSTGEGKITEGETIYNELLAELQAGQQTLSQKQDELAEGKEELAEGRAAYDKQVAEAQQALADARKQLDEGRAALNKAASDLEERRNELAQAEAVYKAAQAMLSAVEDILEQSRLAYEQATEQLLAKAISQEEFNRQMDDAGARAQNVLASNGIALSYVINNVTMERFVYDDAQSIIDEVRNRPFTIGGRTVTLNTAESAIAEARQALDAAQAELNNKQRELEQGKSDYADALKRYETEKAAAEQRIAEGEQQVAESEQQLAEGEQQLAEGEAAINDLSDTLDEARLQLNDLVDYSWVIVSRLYNGGVWTLDAFANITANLRWSMASLFLVVGILVCYASMSRIVHEQVTRIGAKKAVGFTDLEASLLFLLYATATVVLGIVLGIVLALALVDPVLIHAVEDLFVIPFPTYSSVPDVALIGLLEVALVVGAAWIAVRSVLKRQAVELLAGGGAPSSKQHFYEKWPLWQRLGLLTQITINNCVSDTRRVVGTLVGVAGCTALIVCAITLNNNVLDALSRHYDAVDHYDTRASVVPESEAQTTGPQELYKAGMRACPVYSTTVSLEQPDAERSTATLIVPMDQNGFDQFVTLIPVYGSDLSAEGVWVSQAYSEHLGAHIGDNVHIIDGTGKQHELPIAGFFEYHLLKFEIVLDRNTYEQAFGVTLSPNSLLVDTQEHDTDDVIKVLGDTDGFVAATNEYEYSCNIFGKFSGVANIVVIIYLALAIIMAACVLLNLDIMFVDEKKQELIVLMICGFSLKDAKGYIWHDSVVLTALGIVAGLVIGNIAGGVAVVSIEESSYSFLHGIDWIAIGAGILGSAVLAGIALLIALRRIGKFDLTDINRF